ncbi:MAG: septal ring lytic transglycosylase RlpA family protein [Nitrosomonas sp.]|nr:MAG: septal ring lytic transglycosylase RlpA family protein [Nitrosomonas sp.]
MTIFTIILTAGLMTACSSIPQQHNQHTVGQKADKTAVKKIKAAKNNIALNSKNGGGYYLDDGPDDNPPADLHLIPDAEPKHELLRPANMQPYVALGKQYTPMTALKPYKRRGVATWYGRRYHGSNTASGEVYDMYAMTAAHPTLPLPSYVRVTNLDNGNSVVVRLNDRGPFLSDRLIDLSYTAAYKLGIIANGSGRVEVESILPEGAAIAAHASPKVPPLRSAPFVSDAEVKPVYLQLAAFGSSDNARNFLAQAQKKLPDIKDTISISKNNGLYKIQAGPYPNQIVAKMDVGAISQQLGVKPLLVID